jgi:F-type H+-transporting ATPase subunit epsilon
MTLQVSVAVPEGEIWSGQLGSAGLVIAKTLDGDLGVMTGHSPVLGILTEGSVVRIIPRYGSARPDAEGENPADQGGGAGDEVVAAVSGGFFSAADDRVSILARQAQMGGVVDQAATRAALEKALADEESLVGTGGEESAEVRYLRALLKASGDDAVTG